MSLVIEFDDEAGTSGTLTRYPTWLGRLFGRRPHVAHFHRATGTWYFSYDGVEVGTDLRNRLDEERRWRTVKELPAAIVETKRHDE